MSDICVFERGNHSLATNGRLLMANQRSGGFTVSFPGDRRGDRWRRRVMVGQVLYLKDGVAYQTRVAGSDEVVVTALQRVDDRFLLVLKVDDTVASETWLDEVKERGDEEGKTQTAQS